MKTGIFLNTSLVSLTHWFSMNVERTASVIWDIVYLRYDVCYNQALPDLAKMFTARSVICEQRWFMQPSCSVIWHRYLSICVVHADNQSFVHQPSQYIFLAFRSRTILLIGLLDAVCFSRCLCAACSIPFSDWYSVRQLSYSGRPTR